MAVLAAATLYQLSPLSGYLDGKLLDSQFRQLRSMGLGSVDAGPVIVGINERTFKRFREPLALWHAHLGAFLDAMAAARPSLLIMDVVLPDRSYDFVAPGSDRALLAGLLRAKKAIPIVLARTIDERARNRALFVPIASVAGPRSLGLALVDPDADGTVRRMRPLFVTKKGQFQTLVGRAAERLEVKPGPGGFINYALGAAYPYVPIQRVIDWYRKGDQDALDQAFRGKPVLLGAILPFTDRHRLPVALAAWEPGNRRLPGVLIHAQALRSLLAGGLLRKAPATAVGVLLLIAALLWWLGDRPRLGLAVLGAVLVAVWGGDLYALAHGWVVPLSGVLFTATLALFGRFGLEGGWSFIDRRRMKASFGRYVSPNVLDQILTGGIRPEMHGERRRVCVLFSDIRRFTTRSEHQPPEAIIALLNDYFEEMTAAVHEHGGTVDKFIGDGMMAFFGAPNPRPNPARDAFASGKEMLARLESLNERLAAKGIEPLRIGVGLHLGEVVIGHVGSHRRHEYTAIGDAVNTASRLEGLTKTLGYPLVCSAAVAAELDGNEILADLGEQPVKGRAPVAVLGWRPHPATRRSG